MGVSGLSTFYIEHILKKELKPALNLTRLIGKKLILGNWCPTLVWLSLCRMGLQGNMNLWSILDCKANKKPRPLKMPLLRRFLQYAWKTISLQHIVSLIPFDVKTN